MWTAGTLQRWHCLTCRQPLTRLILLRRLQESCGLHGNVLDWFASYLRGRSHHVNRGPLSSTLTVVLYGVLQSSVFGPILFLLYTADLLRLIGNHGLLPHLYADDTQILGSCRPGATSLLQSRMSSCIAAWMQSNRLQLNAAKTEVLWCASSRRWQQLPSTPLRVGHLPRLRLVDEDTCVKDCAIVLCCTATDLQHSMNNYAACAQVARCCAGVVSAGLL